MSGRRAPRDTSQPLVRLGRARVISACLRPADRAIECRCAPLRDASLRPEMLGREFSCEPAGALCKWRLALSRCASRRLAH